MSEQRKKTRTLFFEILLGLVAVFSGVILLASLITPNANMLVMVIAGVLFTLSLVIMLRLVLDPDTVRAKQTNNVLGLASETLAALQAELNPVAAQKICNLLLPATSACAVAITSTEHILGYAGVRQSDDDNSDGLIRTAATHATISDGQTRILMSPEEIGFPLSSHSIRAAIIVPLIVSGRSIGTLKFYYRSPRAINETQISVAEGFGELLSTQIAAMALEQQTKLATSMELKALQSQINPHFLFNTINTIASFIRTDPNKARKLLREFAVFYRRTLEDSTDLILLEREIEQTCRYFSFEVARFGEDRLGLITDVDSSLQGVYIPAFMIQPLVENAVRHAMPSEGKLSITIRGVREGDDVIIKVIDDGTGMTNEARENILHPSSETGLGIAIKNISDRIRSYYGADSRIGIETEPGEGTTMIMYLKDGALLDES